MSKSFELRDKPILQISLDESGIKINDAANPQNNGTYLFEQIKNVDLKPERTSWFASILSYVVDLITGSAFGGKFKNKANLKLELINQTIKIWLIDADFEKAERVVELIKSNKNYTQQ